VAINKLILKDFLPTIRSKNPVVLSAFRISECPGQSSEETDEGCGRVEERQADLQGLMTCGIKRPGGGKRGINEMRWA